MKQIAELLGKVNDKSEYYYIHKDRYTFILNQIFNLKLQPGAKILDVGCFPLHLFQALELAGFEVYGISSMHEKVKHKNIVSLNIERDKLPFEKNSFDLILFSEVLEHLIYTPQVYMEKFRLCLKPGGFLLLTTPNAVQIKRRLMSLFGKSQGFELFQLYESEVENDYIYHRHNREFTLQEVEKIVAKADLKIVKAGEFSAYNPLRVKLHNDPSYVKISKGIVFLPTLMFPQLRDSLFVVAQKRES